MSLFWLLIKTVISWCWAENTHLSFSLLGGKKILDTSRYGGAWDLLPFLMWQCSVIGPAGKGWEDSLQSCASLDYIDKTYIGASFPHSQHLNRATMEWTEGGYLLLWKGVSKRTCCCMGKAALCGVFWVTFALRGNHSICWLRLRWRWSPDAYLRFE